AEHAPAVVVGLLPGVAAWGVLMANRGLMAAGYGAPGRPFSGQLVGAFHQTSGTWIEGGFALDQGFIFTSMILAAVTVAVIERQFRRAAGWCLVAALLSAVGLMHSYEFFEGGTKISLTPAWPWVQGYLIMGGCFFLARWLTVPHKGH